MVCVTAADLAATLATMSDHAWVLMPGMDGTGDLFRPLVDALGDSRSVHVLRYPTDELLDYDALLPRILDALPKDEDYVLVAESFSGPLALRVAAARPRGLSSLVLCASFVTCPLPFPMSKLAWLTGLLRIPLVPSGLRSWLMLGRFDSPDLRTMFISTCRQVPSRVLAARVRDVLRVDLRSELANCSYPLLYLRATEDRVVRARNARQIQAVNPVVEVEDVEAPHLLLQVAPTRAIEVIDTFLSSWLKA